MLSASLPIKARSIVLLPLLPATTRYTADSSLNRIISSSAFRHIPEVPLGNSAETTDLLDYLIEHPCSSRLILWYSTFRNEPPRSQGEIRAKYTT